MSTNDIVNDFINTLAEKVVAQASSRIEAMIEERVAARSPLKLNDPALLNLIDIRSRDMATQVLEDEEEIDPAITASAVRLLQADSEFHEQLRNLAHRTAERVVEQEDIESKVRRAVDDSDLSDAVQDAIDDFDLSREIREAVETEVDDRMANHRQDVAQTVRDVLSTATISLPAK